MKPIVKSLYYKGLSLSGWLLVGCLLSGCQGTPQGPSGPDTRMDQAQQGIFYPPAPDVPRLQFLTSISTSADLGPGAVRKVSGFERFVLGDEETEVSDRILKPYGMALDDGKLYVCDVQKRAVEVLDLEAETFGYLTRERRMTNPVNLCIVNGIKYVADPSAEEIFVFGRDNELKTILGSDLDLKPVDVDVRGRRCYVTDMNKNQVVVIDIGTGEVITRMGAAGDELGQFVLIGDMALDEQENLYVTDKLLGRITKFNREGLFQKAFGQAGDSIHHFVRPKGISVDHDGRIWVVDAAPEVAKIYDSDGRLLMYFGFPGDTPGSMNLPASIFIDYDHVALFRKYMAPGAQIEFLVLVSNQYGKKINVYGFGRFPEQESAIAREREASTQDFLAQTSPSVSRPQPSSNQDRTRPSEAVETVRMQEIANIYYRSMYLYRNGRYREARGGFVEVLNSGQIPPPMAQTIRQYLSDIDQHMSSGR